MGCDITYELVKAAVLKAYKLVPEAYRQRFRTWGKWAHQSHMEFVRELTNHFIRWCVASSVDNFDGLCNLVILEQFKDTLSKRVATYLNERKVTTAAEAAGLADEYVLVHKGWLGEPGREPVGLKEVGRSSPSFGMSSGKGSRAAPQKGEDVCNYCREAGHWKSDVRC